MLAWVIDHPVQTVFRLLTCMLVVTWDIRALPYMYALIPVLQLLRVEALHT